jgi:hypothetical protein
MKNELVSSRIWLHPSIDDNLVVFATAMVFCVTPIIFYQLYKDVYIYYTCHLCYSNWSIEIWQQWINVVKENHDGNTLNINQIWQHPKYMLVKTSYTYLFIGFLISSLNDMMHTIFINPFKQKNCSWKQILNYILHNIPPIPRPINLAIT